MRPPQKQTSLQANHIFRAIAAVKRSIRGQYALLLACLGLSFTGCEPGAPEIRSYDVPRQKNTPTTAASSAPATAEPRRMLGAIIPAGEDAWFLKAVGSPVNVEKMVPEFEKLLGSFTVQASGEPKWDLPSNWKQQPGSGMRFATLVATSDGEEIPISVIKLPIFEGTWEEYCESNVNRWRGELSLPNEKWNEMVKYAKPIEGKESGSAGASRLGYWINLEGKQDKSRSMAAPFASGSSAASAPAATSPATSGAVAPFAGPASQPSSSSEPGKPSPLKYEVPAGWSDRGASGMRLLTLWVGEGTTPPNEITIIPASGDLTSNVRRWQEQISENVTDEMVNQSIEKAIITKVDGVETKVVHLVDSAEQPKEAIMAAVIPMDAQSSLFIKYKGDAKTAETEKANFIKFVESVRWK